MNQRALGYRQYLKNSRLNIPQTTINSRRKKKMEIEEFMQLNQGINDATINMDIDQESGNENDANNAYEQGNEDGNNENAYYDQQDDENDNDENVYYDQQDDENGIDENAYDERYDDDNEENDEQQN
ncbi:phosphopantothenoylcysteine decarboxylase subunit VHS3-like [Solenopsis invicta]|uniref:phosphopantothenoylcysteine decarboxylase subunit VHS3-like n=1 Tax=Solenopsis invicta TaxID=13686 RepID=UPI00193E6C62|nr:phosphopantothenoylcysteine decarboxylase subunit VHS3-like [Solenopsis invicta]